MKDLTAFLLPNLDLKVGTKTYSVPPPSQADGLKLAAIVSSGTNIATGAAVDAETQKILDTMGTVEDISQISLGTHVYQQMIADGVPGPHLNQAGSYAMYYWVLGEATADSMFDTMYGQEQEAAPKARKNGRNTVSGNRTKTASTPGTGSRGKSAPSPRKKATPSRGGTSSTAGA